MKKVIFKLIVLFIFTILTMQVSAMAEEIVYVANDGGYGLNPSVSVIDIAINGVSFIDDTLNRHSGYRAVAVNPSGTRVYATDYNNVLVINTTTNTVIATVAVAADLEGIAVNPSGSRVYVANAGGNNVSIINTTTNTVITTVAVGTKPEGVAVNPSGSRVYVANAGSNNVSIIDTTTNTVITTVAVGARPEGITVDPSGSRVYVTNYGDDTLSIINTATNTVLRTGIALDGPWGVAVNPSGSRVYVANAGGNNVSIINTITNTLITTVTVGTEPGGVAINPSGSRVYVANHDDNTISIIDTSTNTVLRTVAQVGDGPWGITVTSTPVAVGTPVPTIQSTWNYSSIVNPVIQTNATACKPFAIGDLSSGNLNLQVGLPAFSQGVDVYLALQSDVIANGELLLFDQNNNILPVSTVLPKWKNNDAAAITESLYGDIPTSLLPSGLYNLYVAVVPSGETDFSHFYFWVTSFNINH